MVMSEMEKAGEELSFSLKLEDTKQLFYDLVSVIDETKKRKKALQVCILIEVWWKLYSLTKM